MTLVWQAGALRFQRDGAIVPGHPASTRGRLRLEPNTLSVDPVPLFIPAKRQRDFPSERILAEQVGNHWVCVPWIPSPATRSCLSLLASTSLSVQRTDVTVLGPAPPRKTAGLLGLHPGSRAGRRRPRSARWPA